MRFLFDPESKIMQFLSRLGDIALLNVIFLLTCLPIFTIGAANTALYDVVFRMDTEREGKLLPTYFRSFKDNFRQSTVIWLLLLLFGAATYLNMTRFSDWGGPLGYGLFLAAMLVFVMLILIFSYAFPLLSQFRNSVTGTLKNALLLSVAYLPRSVALAAINCFPWAMMLVNLYTFSRFSCLWAFLYFSSAAYIGSRILIKVFQPYREQVG